MLLQSPEAGLKSKEVIKAERSTVLGSLVFCGGSRGFQVFSGLFFPRLFQFSNRFQLNPKHPTVAADVKRFFACSYVEKSNLMSKHPLKPHVSTDEMPGNSWTSSYCPVCFVVDSLCHLVDSLRLVDESINLVNSTEPSTGAGRLIAIFWVIFNLGGTVDRSDRFGSKSGFFACFVYWSERFLGAKSGCFFACLVYCGNHISLKLFAVSRLGRQAEKKSKKQDLRDEEEKQEKQDTKNPPNIIQLFMIFSFLPSTQHQTDINKSQI